MYPNAEWGLLIMACILALLFEDAKPKPLPKPPAPVEVKPVEVAPVAPQWNAQACSLVAFTRREAHNAERVQHTRAAHIDL